MHGYVRVKDLAPGGPAERCGVIDTGDILVDVGGQVCDLKWLWESLVMLL